MNERIAGVDYAQRTSLHTPVWPLSRELETKSFPTRLQGTWLGGS